jgi:hypothetical protein
VLSITLSVPDGFIYISDMIIWSQDHAYLFGPSHRFDMRKMAWVKRGDLSSLVGKTKDLITHRKDQNTARYCGTFKCLSFPDMSSKHRDTLPDHVRFAVHPFERGVAEQVFQLRNILQRQMFNFEGSHPFKSIVDEIWKKGVIRIECVGLQYVGFNDKLYDELVLWDDRHAPVPAPEGIPIEIPTAGGSSSSKRKDVEDHSGTVSKKAKTGKPKSKKKAKAAKSTSGTKKPKKG